MGEIQGIESKETKPTKSLSETVFEITGYHAIWPNQPAELSKLTREEKLNAQQERWRQIDSISKHINKRLEELFPQTLPLIPAIRYFQTRQPYEKEQLRPIIQSRLDALPQEQKEALGTSSADTLTRLHEQDLTWSFKEQGRQLYDIASFLQRNPLNEETSLTELRGILHEKKILILGDDTGSLSEILNILGANAYGIEGNPGAVQIAHSGLLAEDMKPQNQVIHGNLLDLRNENSDLYKNVQKKGPFDVVFSRAVFNSGSGFPEGFEHLAKRENSSEGALWQEWFKGTDKLLTNGGFHLHTNVDIMLHGTYLEEFAMKIQKSLDGDDNKGKEVAKNNLSMLEQKFCGWPLADVSRGYELQPRNGGGFLLMAGLIPYIRERM